MQTTIDPIKLCCSQPASKHAGPICPDDRVMCCYCYMRVHQDELSADKNGHTQDVCMACWYQEQAILADREDRSAALS